MHTPARRHVRPQRRPRLEVVRRGEVEVRPARGGAARTDGAEAMAATATAAAAEPARARAIIIAVAAVVVIKVATTTTTTTSSSSSSSFAPPHDVSGLCSLRQHHRRRPGGPLVRLLAPHEALQAVAHRVVELELVDGARAPRGRAVSAHERAAHAAVVPPPPPVERPAAADQRASPAAMAAMAAI